MNYLINIQASICNQEHRWSVLHNFNRRDRYRFIKVMNCHYCMEAPFSLAPKLNFCSLTLYMYFVRILSKEIYFWKLVNWRFRTNTMCYNIRTSLNAKMLNMKKNTVFWSKEIHSSITGLVTQWIFWQPQLHKYFLGDSFIRSTYSFKRAKTPSRKEIPVDGFVGLNIFFVCWIFYLLQLLNEVKITTWSSINDCCLWYHEAHLFQYDLASRTCQLSLSAWARCQCYLRITFEMNSSENIGICLSLTFLTVKSDTLPRI